MKTFITAQKGNREVKTTKTPQGFMSRLYLSGAPSTTSAMHKSEKGARAWAAKQIARF